MIFMVKWIRGLGPMCVMMHVQRAATNSLLEVLHQIKMEVVDYTRDPITLVSTVMCETNLLRRAVPKDKIVLHRIVSSRDRRGQ